MPSEHYGPPDDLYDPDAGCHPDELADLLRLVRDTRKAWADLEAVLEADLGMSVGVGQFDGYVVRQAAEKVEWDDDEVKRRVVREAKYAAEVAVGDPSDKVAEWIWKCVPERPRWRVGGLKQLGIDPADYRTRLPGRFTVQLTDDRDVTPSA